MRKAGLGSVGSPRASASGFTDSDVCQFVAVAASDSDGSPPGCLIIGSTGQEVIHVYDRRNNAMEFTP